MYRESRYLVVLLRMKNATGSAEGKMKNAPH